MWVVSIILAYPISNCSTSVIVAGALKRKQHLFIGESLFTIFASLAYTTEFLMELEINQFWILKDHGTINCQWILAWCVEYLLCNTGLKTQNFIRMYELIGAFATQKFCSFWKVKATLALSLHVLAANTNAIIECVQCHAIKNKIKNRALNEVKKLRYCKRQIKKTVIQV